ncbi:hypothetical protein [Streptomyces vastus]|uniref:Uncharacterized protein n=1 Tax=Streptomyces vastus TaxID=285451 RepID=A0ABP6CPS9_9ACTN
MSNSSGPHGRMTPAPNEINNSIRQLMDEPAGRKRTAEYERLLALWTEATRDDVEPAA